MHARRDGSLNVTDILLLAVLVAFFALTVLFVRACDRIIGPDLEGESTNERANETTSSRRAA